MRWERERPRFAVWGARMNLRKAGGTAVCQPRFRLPRNRGVHTARPRGSLGCNVGSDEPPNHHEQSRERVEDLSLRAGVGQALPMPLNATVRKKYGSYIVE